MTLPHVRRNIQIDTFTFQETLRMLTVSSPVASATVSDTGFEVSGTCSSDHQVTVRLTMSSSGQYYDYYTRACQGGWSTTVTPWGDGPYKISVTCDGMTNPISVDLTVGVPQA
jgi:hypothetical protein